VRDREPGCYLGFLGAGLATVREGGPIQVSRHWRQSFACQCEFRKWHGTLAARQLQDAEIILAAVASARSWEHPLASCPMQPGPSCRRQLEEKTNRSCRDSPLLCLSHRVALNFPHTRDYRTSGKNALSAVEG
jgi:hypothetical protein